MSTSAVGSLELESVIGFAGNVSGSLILHNDDSHILYALGSTVVVKHLLKNEQYFLQCAGGGSQTAVSCIKLSNDGKLLATGQKTHAGFPASIWIWDLESRKVLHKLDLYKSKIQSISFSASNKYIATLGGEDNNNLVIWNVETGDSICGSPAANDTALCCSFSNTNDNTLVTAGKYNFRIWKFDKEARKIRPTDCRLGALKRVFNCIVITADDEKIYAGTQSGDILEISLQHTLFQKKNTKPFSMGIQSIALTKDGKHVLVGTGNGVIALLGKNKLNTIRSLSIASDLNKASGYSGVTSIAINRADDHFFVGTNKSTIYLVAISDFDYELRHSAHYNRINDIVFPANYSDLFVTAGVNDIRVWNIKNRSELLRINVPNLECSCVIIANDGKSIVSGWNDGNVRAFYPETGRLMYIIHDCHAKGVTAMALASDGRQLVTGGNDALVRIWNLNKNNNTYTPKMLSSLREHQNAISSICINKEDTQFVTSSLDGSCVAWDFKKCSRTNALFSSTQFLCVVYHPDESQLITTGTDRQISYWDATDLSQIRIVNASESDQVNKLFVNSNGTMFCSCSNDTTLKLWHYDEGIVHSIGYAHSGNITSCKISPNDKYIVSVGDEGAICIWNMPNYEPQNENVDNTN